MTSDLQLDAIDFSFSLVSELPLLCRPWSQIDFHRRLSTFTISFFPSISPPPFDALSLILLHFIEHFAMGSKPLAPWSTRLFTLRLAELKSRRSAVWIVSSETQIAYVFFLKHETNSRQTVLEIRLILSMLVSTSAMMNEWCRDWLHPMKNLVCGEWDNAMVCWRMKMKL